MANVVNFDERVLNAFNKKEENIMKKEIIKKEQVAPEVKNARSFWYGVMAPAIAEAKKAAKAAEECTCDECPCTEAEASEAEAEEE